MVERKQRAESLRDIEGAGSRSPRLGDLQILLLPIPAQAKGNLNCLEVTCMPFY